MARARMFVAVIAALFLLASCSWFFGLKSGANPAAESEKKQEELKVAELWPPCRWYYSQNYTRLPDSGIPSYMQERCDRLAKHMKNRDGQEEKNRMHEWAKRADQFLQEQK